MRVRAKFVKPSVCACGFPVLADHVNIGKEYIVDTSRFTDMTFRCGGCQQTLPCLCIYVTSPGPPGFLPVQIFEIDEGEAA